MKNTSILLTLLASTVLASPSLFAAKPGGNAARPNIVWLTSEDNSAHWMGCYGDKNARTPHIDKLATEGVLYTHAYANAPVCAVARSTLITGVYACSLGTQNMRSRYAIPGDIRPCAEILRKAGYYCTNASKTDYNFDGNDRSYWDECSKKAHWKNRPEGKPFFAIFNTTSSHESSLFRKKEMSIKTRVDPGSIKLPPYLPDTPELRHDWACYHDILEKMDSIVGGHLKELEDAGLAENTIVFYYSDHGGILPRAKRYLHDTGTHVPLIVRIPKKWAKWAPSGPGTKQDQPVGFIDFTPTLLSLAGVPIPEYMQGRAFLGDQKKPAEPYTFLFGQRFDSRILRFERGVTDGDYRYIKNFHPHRKRFGTTGYAFSQKGWVSWLAAWKDGKCNPRQSLNWENRQAPEELFHTAADPWEVKNLADDPSQKDRLEKMRAACLAKMREIRDTGIVPEAMNKELIADGTLREYVRSKDFPYENLLKLALVASSRDASTLPALRAAMKHAHPVMRYWGANGCVILGKDAAPAKSGLEPLLDDKFAATRVVAAKALAQIGELDRGLKSLLGIVERSNDDIVLLEALNALEDLGAVDQIPEPTLKRIKASYAGRMTKHYLKLRKG